MAASINYRSRVCSSSCSSTMIKCVCCGRFISYSDFQNKEVVTEFEPDSHFGPEVIDHYHKECHDKLMANKKSL